MTEGRREERELGRGEERGEGVREGGGGEMHVQGKRDDRESREKARTSMFEYRGRRGESR